MDSQLTVVHQTESYTSPNGPSGINLGMFPNGTIYWDFYHYVNIPVFYQTYNFSITKPLNWNIISIASPNGFEVPYSFGGINDSWVSVNSTYAGIDGWWHIQGNIFKLVVIE